ncbi:MAG: NUDIX domain-containing protein [Christensenellaceae bacterium]|nr:NUDIX domain-containing protein [Christensenellaceae bacterium]
MTFEKSCGAVVYTTVNGEIRYVLIQELSGAWGFPKGHMEKEETEMQTALREIDEEVHLKVDILKGFRATETYAPREKANVVKQVVYFCAAYDRQELRAQDSELLQACLLTYEEALQRLTFEGSRRILREARDFIQSQFVPSDRP